MSWISVLLAGCFEMVGVIGITMVSQRPTPRSYVVLVGGFALSFMLLSYAMSGLSMSTAYAVWTGIGTVGSTLVGMFVYDEPKDKWRLFFIFLIILSVIGLKVYE